MGIKIAAALAMVLWVCTRPGASIIGVDPGNAGVAAASAANVQAVTVSGSFAYIGEDDGLSILNIDDPTHPITLGHVVLPGAAFANHIQVVGGHAYVTNLASSLHIINVHDPAHPVVEGSYDTGKDAWDVDVVDQRAYVAAGIGGLHIVDVSNPSKAILLGMYSTDNLIPNFENTVFSDVEVVGSLAYVGGGLAGLLILDVSDPAHPSLQGQYRPPLGPHGNEAQYVAVKDGFVYVSCLGEGLQIVDVHDPRHPQPRGSYALDVCSGNIQVVNGLAYIPLGDLLIVDVHNPDTPIFNRAYVTPGWAVDTDIEGGLAYVADWEGGLRIIDLLAPGNNFQFAKDFQVADTYVYIADGGNGMWIVDVHDLQKPTVVGSYHTAGYAWNLDIVDQRAYIAINAYEQTGLQIIDVSDPVSPTLLGSYSTTAEVMDVKVVGHLAYLAQNVQELAVVDVGDPANPRLLGEAVGGFRGDSAHKVDVDGSFAYVTSSGGGVAIFDIHDPHHPIPIGGYASSIAAMEVVGNILYCLTDDGLVIIDANNPASPSELSRYATPGWPTAIQVLGNLAYIAYTNGQDSGILILDISDPAHPVPHQTIPLAGKFRFMEVVDKTLYLIGDQGLRIFGLTESAPRVFLPIIQR